jgi:hypothetical protein
MNLFRGVPYMKIYGRKYRGAVGLALKVAETDNHTISS